MICVDMQPDSRVIHKYYLYIIHFQNFELADMDLETKMNADSTEEDEYIGVFVLSPW